MNVNAVSSIQNTSTPPTTLVIVDDDREICEGLTILFGVVPEVQVLAVGHSGEEAIGLVREHKPQILLLDLHFGEGIDGIEVIKRISYKGEPHCNIVVYTIDVTKGALFEAIKAGAKSYVSKEQPYSDLVKIVLAAANGEAYVSPTIAEMALEFFEATEQESIQQG